MVSCLVIVIGMSYFKPTKDESYNFIIMPRGAGKVYHQHQVMTRKIKELEDDKAELLEYIGELKDSYTQTTGMLPIKSRREIREYKGKK